MSASVSKKKLVQLEEPYVGALGDKGFPHIKSLERISTAASSFPVGKSIQPVYQHVINHFRPDSHLPPKVQVIDITKPRPDTVVPNSIKTNKDIHASFPVPKPKTAKEKKALEEKKKAEEEARLAAGEEHKVITTEQALQST